MTTFTTVDPITGESREVGGRMVTCVTPNCGNNGIPIEIPDDGSLVICGVCGDFINTENLNGEMVE